MSEREEWINLIRNEYDPRPDLGKGAYPAFDSEWDDGAGRIADAIIADKTLAAKMTKEQEDAITAAYMGICVLSTMCRKAGLSMGRLRSEELLKEISEAFPALYERILLTTIRSSPAYADPNFKYNEETGSYHRIPGDGQAPLGE